MNINTEWSEIRNHFKGKIVVDFILKNIPVNYRNTPGIIKISVYWQLTAIDCFG